MPTPLSRLRRRSNLLLVGALVAFGAFWLRAHRSRFESESGRQGSRAATLVRGRAEVKPAGASFFTSATEPTPLYNRDSVWVPKGQDAWLVFTDGSSMHLKEETFLVIRKGLSLQTESDPTMISQGAGAHFLTGDAEVAPPDGLFASFSARLGLAPEMRVRSPSGDVIKVPRTEGTHSVQRLRDAHADTKPIPDPSAMSSPASPGPSTPRAAPSAASAGGEKRVHVTPAPDALLLTMTPGYPSEARPLSLRFGWNEPLATATTLMVKRTEPAGMAPQNIAVPPRAPGVTVNLRAGGQYVWILQDGNGAPLEGPHQFSILPFNQAELDAVIKKDPKRTVEILE